MMEYERILTIVCAAASVALAYVIVSRILRTYIASAFVVLPLALSLPWSKSFPAVADATSLLATVAVLGVWLHCASGRPHAIRNALIAAGAIIVVKQDILLLVLGAAAIEGWRRRREFRPAESVGTIAALAFLACMSMVFLSPYEPATTVEGLARRLMAGTSWDGTNWTFAGADIRASVKSASTYGATFYLPLLLPFAAMAWKCRREWWFVPTFGWCVLVFAFTVILAKWPTLRACPPLATTFLVTFGVSGVKLLREQLPALRRVKETGESVK